MKQFFTLLTLISTLISQAQTTKGKISGTVIDGSQKTIESGTIALVRAKDSSTIKFAVADKQGRFVFDDVPNGHYLVSVSIVGHQKGFSEPLEISEGNQNIQLKPIEMVMLSKTMNNVVITAKRPFIEQKIDKMVINVESSITSAGSSALDVLEKSPGVTVDKDGNISLKGKQNVMIMMDGKPAYLSGTDLVNYLRSLPSSAIDQIEIMTNPSAKYDAAGNSGIINIKSKKNRQTGFNGNFTVNYQQGRYWKSNNSLNLNYRIGKVNLFMNSSTNKGNGFTELDILRTFKDAATKDIEAIFQQQTRMRNENQFSNLKMGADYFITKRTTLGIVTSGFLNPGTFSSKSLSYLKNAGNVVDSIVYAESGQNNNWKNGTVNLNFRHQFDSTGREITSDLDYITYRQSQSQDFFNKTYNPDWTL
ncbi:MAG: TonB-dependent receptor, partial [Flavisolibacter sp.]